MQGCQVGGHNVWVDRLSGPRDGCPRGSRVERRCSSWSCAWKPWVSRRSTGSAGVLFAGLLLGQAGLHIDQNILEFVRDFGLILFVYTVGLQVGPSFFSSLKRRGLQLNIIASTIVLRR